MGRPSRYPLEFKERALRLVFESEAEHPSQWSAICSVAHQLGMSHETLRNWVRQAERDEGHRPGPTGDQVAEPKRLRAESAELRRANEILKSAAAFFGAELDRRPKR